MDAFQHCFIFLVLSAGLDPLQHMKVPFIVLLTVNIAGVRCNA
jgi:hypothetical protein